MDTKWQTILVVDDEQSVREVICSLLEEEGYRVLQAAGGRAALALLERQRPSLIVSDVTMPGMDGFAFYKQVQARFERPVVPFIFLTARDEPVDVRRGMELGADDYLTKPFEPDSLLAAVRVRLARAAATDAAIYRGTQALRDIILRILSHELRTPLMLLIGYGELLEESARRLNDDEFIGLLRDLRTGSQRLARLVDQVLLLSELESGTLQDRLMGPEQQTFPPDDLAADVVRELENEATARGTSLRLEQGADGACVAANPRHVAELIRHLVDNAIKFSPAQGGKVILKSRADPGYWILDVADQGVGIRPDALGQIFQAFRQVDREKMEQQGAGLGLAIVRCLCELYGGGVAVASEPGRGSTFTVRLPRTHAG